MWFRAAYFKGIIYRRFEESLRILCNEVCASQPVPHFCLLSLTEGQCEEPRARRAGEMSAENVLEAASPSG